MKVEISKINAGANVRRTLGRLDGLMSSIQEVGILEPLVVHTNGDGYELIAGFRRLEAASRLGFTEVPVTVRDDLTETQRKEAQLVENLQRDELTAIEEAEGMFALTELGLTRKEVASKIGQSQRIVGDRIRLLDLPKPVQDKIHQGQLSLGAGLELVKHATDPELVEATVEGLLEGRHRRGVSDAIEAESARLKKIETIEKLDAKVAKLREAGVNVVVQENGIRPDEAAKWKRIDSEREWGDVVRVDAKAHRKEPCDAYVYLRPDPSYWNSPDLLQHCTNPRRHTFTGLSDLKVIGAEKEHEQSEESKAKRKLEREALAERRNLYSQAVDSHSSQWKSLAPQMIWSLSSYDMRKEAAKEILGLEPVEVQGQKSYDQPLRDLLNSGPAGMKKVTTALMLAYGDPLNPATFTWMREELVEGLKSWFE